jgi:hypothetical protein
MATAISERMSKSRRLLISLRKLLGVIIESCCTCKIFGKICA